MPYITHSNAAFPLFLDFYQYLHINCQGLHLLIFTAASYLEYLASTTNVWLHRSNPLTQLGLPLVVCSLQRPRSRYQEIWTSWRSPTSSPQNGANNLATHLNYISAQLQVCQARCANMTNTARNPVQSRHQQLDTSLQWTLAKGHHLNYPCRLQQMNSATALFRRYRVFWKEWTTCLQTVCLFLLL